MAFDDFSSLAAVTLAGSLAMERLVTVAKTWKPDAFANPEYTPPGGSELVYDKRRRRRVVGLTLAASLLTAWIVADPYEPKAALVCGPSSRQWVHDAICRQVAYTPTNAIHWIVFALMISGGSAFWANIVGYMSAAKDARTQDKVSQRVPATDDFPRSSAVEAARPVLPGYPPAKPTATQAPVAVPPGQSIGAAAPPTARKAP